jgi:hypothetical protein
VSWLVLVAALPLLLLLVYLAGVRHGERIGEQRGRRLRWTDREERYALSLEQWRIEP